MKINLSKILILLLIVAPLFFGLIAFTGCNTTVSGISEKPIVYASFFPIYDLAREIIGDADLDLRCFMPPNQDPHMWEPTPRDIQRLGDADLLILNGANMEERWMRDVRENLPDLNVLTLSDFVELITYKGAAARGDFQFMAKIELESGKTYSIDFAHTHEDIMRIAFIRENNEFTTSNNHDQNSSLIEHGKKIMEELGELVHQQDTIDVTTDKVYGIEMGHDAGIVYFTVPEDGIYYFVSDRISEQLLPYTLISPTGEEMKYTAIVEGSTSGLDKITYDPHSWLSLSNAKKYLNAISQELGNLYPEQERNFHKNKVKVVGNITQLEFVYQKKFEEIQQKNFVTAHYAYAYLANEFSLKQYPLQGLISMEDPSLKTIRKAVMYCKATDVNTIFYEVNGQSKGANTIALEIDGQIMDLNSMEFVNPEENLSYLEIMKDNINKIYESMRN